MWCNEVMANEVYLEKEPHKKLLLGPFFTVILAACLIGADLRHAAVPYSPAMMLIAVVFSAYLGGLASALLSLGCALSYVAYHFSDVRDLFVYSDENFESMLLWSFASTLAASVVVFLKNRSEMFLSSDRAFRKKLEAALQRSEAQLRAFLAGASDAFVATDKGGKVLAWNKAAERTFGWKAEEALDGKLTDLIFPLRYRKAHSEWLARALVSDEDHASTGYRLEVTALHRDGHELPVEMTIYPIQQGDTYVFGSFLHDISEKKKAATLQMVQLAVTRVLVDAKTMEDALPHLLESICRGTGWSAGEFWRVSKSQGILERTDVWFHSDPKLSQFYQASLNILQKGAGLPGQVWERRRPLWIQDIHQDDNFPRAAAALGSIHTALGFPIEAGDEIVGVMVFYHARCLPRDQDLLQMLAEIGQRIGIFIQRKEAEDNLTLLNRELEHRVEERTRQLEESNSRLQREIRERQRLYEQAENASRLKDEFLATISHELRTPLNIIIGYADMLRQSGVASRNSRDAVDTIRRNAHVQGQIIDDLLDVSRIITGKLKLNVETVDLEQVVHSTIESLRVAADAKKITIHTDIDASVGPVSGDSARIQQVVWNLLSNAIKFTGSGGEVKITLDRKESLVRLIVEDTGIGIESGFVPYVFDRFRQEDSSTTRTFGGLGLGLSIVRHIVEAHGGTVEAFSEGKGRGARFTVTFPLQAVRIQPGFVRTKGERPQFKPIRRRGELDGLKVLVVDDQEDARTLVEFVLAHAGAEVVTASSAHEAMEVLKVTHPDVILSDIGMPDEDGYEFIRKVRDLNSEYRKTPAAALSAYAREEDRNRSKRAGFQLHVTKPVDAKELVKTISNLVHDVPCSLGKAQ